MPRDLDHTAASSQGLDPGYFSGRLLHEFAACSLQTGSGRLRPGHRFELGVSSFGKNLENAKERLEEAVDLFLENARALHLMGNFEAALSSEERFTTIIEVPA